jgi:hypothetical protein
VIYLYCKSIVDALWTYILMRGLKEVVWDICWLLNVGLCKLDNASPCPITLINRPSLAFLLLYSLLLLGSVNEESFVPIPRSVGSALFVLGHLWMLDLKS